MKEKGYFRNAIAENILKRIPLINEEFKNSLERGKKTDHAKMPAFPPPQPAAKENDNRCWPTKTSDNKAHHNSEFNTADNLMQHK